MSSILGALFAVLIGVLAIRPYISYEHQGMVNTEVAATAGQERLISEAAQAYIQQNYAAVEAASTASTPAVITVPMLETTGFLSTSMASTNPYGQTWQVQVLQPTAGNLQALVLSTGGNTIPQSQAPAIAAQTGQEGGFIPYAGQYGSASPSVAMGAYGGWSVSMAGYTNPGAGHLASLVAFTAGNLQNDYLYRVAVPGQPQLNTMSTNLDMGTNSINDANGVTSMTLDVAQNSGSVTAPSQQNGQYQGIQFGSGTDAEGVIGGHGGNLGFYAPGGSINFYQTPGTFGTMNSGSINATGNVTASGYVLGNQTVAAGTSCSQNGAMATSGALPLFCQSGTWQNSLYHIAGTMTGYSLTPTNSNLGWHLWCGLDVVQFTQAAGLSDNHRAWVTSNFLQNSTGQVDWTGYVLSDDGENDSGEAFCFG